MPIIGATELQPVNILGSYVQGLEMGRANKLAQQQQMRADEEYQMKLSDRESQRRRQELEDKRSGFAMLGQIAGAAVDQPSYDQALQTLQELGVDISRVPPAFDPKVVKGFRDQSLTEAQRIDAELRAGTLGVQQTQAETAATQARTAAERERRLSAPPAATTAPVATAPEQLPPKVRVKRDELFPKATRAVKKAVYDIDRQIETARELRNHPGLGAITGGIEGRLPSFSEDATAAQTLYDNLLASGTLASLTDLRAASETGGALGNVSNQDTQLLTQSVGALSQTQGKQNFQNRIDKYIADLEFARDNAIGAYEDTYAYRGTTFGEKPAQPEAPKPPAKGAIVDGYRFKGGNPADKANWEKVK